jgi:hypothetical protein
VITAIRRALNAFTGEDEFSVTVPPMDGALNPDNRLEEAALVARAEAPDNLCRWGERLLFSSGGELFELEPGVEAPVAKSVASYTATVTALAAHGEALAVGLADSRLLLRGGKHDGAELTMVGGKPLNCITALAFADDDTVLVCLGSERHPFERWKHDLMERGASGSVWRIDLRSKAATSLAQGLAFPFGIIALTEGALVTESWRHRMIKVRNGGFPPEPVLTDLPAYPARIAVGADGKGGWLSLFAPRRQLTEFMLREPAYRKRMMADIDPEYWVGPTLAPMRSFLEPLQGGTLKKLAAIKPWAPSRSYGLVVRLDEHWQPRSSFHSRADGSRHGVMSAVEAQGRLYAASRGAQAVVSVDLQGDE